MKASDDERSFIFRKMSKNFKIICNVTQNKIQSFTRFFLNFLYY